MKFSVIQIGARRNYSVPVALNGIGRLFKLYTDFFLYDASVLNNALRVASKVCKIGILARIRSRTAGGLRKSVVSRSMVLGFKIFLAERIFSKSELEVEQLYAAVLLSRRFINEAAGSPHAVWGYNGASLLSFTFAKKNKSVCILEQVSLPAVIEADIVDELNLFGSTAKYDRTEIDLMATVEKLEWSLADHIVVGSMFVKKSLIRCGIKSGKITVIPSSVDINKFYPRNSPAVFEGERNLRILFVGRVSRAKGANFLLDAAKGLSGSGIEIKLIGKIIDLHDEVSALNGVVQAVGSVAYSEILQYYHWADVFCFPSCFEGSASVTYEALACGVPVITTINSGSVVRHGVDGFIIPVGCSQSVANAIKMYLDNPALLRKQRDNILLDRARLGMDFYRKRIEDFVLGIEDGVSN